jgi:CRISPR-associated protein (TIGR03986 family)
MITAPYNFVPLNEKVFFPPWADYISHDAPFEDAESGEIDITITAKSPIFIRDHQHQEKFCQHDGQYYIPSSSIKGMVRNVLEIMSFSKMNFVDDRTYSIRDLKYSKYMDKIKQGVNCGWLYKENDQLKIEDCGEPYRIKYDEIDKKFNMKFKQNFMNGSFDNAKSPYKKAFEKYKLFKEDIFNTQYSFSSPKSDIAGRKIVTFEEQGTIKGKIVLTGHPSPRNESSSKPSGKIYDFIFPQQEKLLSYDIDKKTFENFKFAYFDGRNTQPQESEDWTFWKKRLNNGEKIPVFFHKNFSGITSFGLSYLYKFPYDNSIFDALVSSHINDEIDLSQAIFGFSEKIDEEQISLKGRVQFSHGIKKENSSLILLEPRYILLGSPKASYYPIYLVQNSGEYKTLMDNNSVLAGWKRYPIHKKFNHKCAGKSKQTSLITPLKESVEFKTRVRIHNLKTIEIGALISSLLFHGNEKCFHSLGMGKPYGYGKVKITIDKFLGFKYTKEEYMKSFEATIN